MELKLLFLCMLLLTVLENSAGSSEPGTSEPALLQQNISDTGSNEPGPSEPPEFQRYISDTGLCKPRKSGPPKPQLQKQNINDSDDTFRPENRQVFADLKEDTRLKCTVKASPRDISIHNVWLKDGKEVEDEERRVIVKTAENKETVDHVVNFDSIIEIANVTDDDYGFYTLVVGFKAVVFELVRPYKMELKKQFLKKKK